MKLKMKMAFRLLPTTPAVVFFAGRAEKTFQRHDPGRFHTAVSTVSGIVFHFSAANVLQRPGHSDVFSAANLKLKCHKREMLDFIRPGCS
jgi:hypothetical protein